MVATTGMSEMRNEVVRVERKEGLSQTVAFAPVAIAAHPSQKAPVNQGLAQPLWSLQGPPCSETHLC